MKTYPLTKPGHRTRARPVAGCAAVLALASLAGCGGSADSAEPERRRFGPVGDRLVISKNVGDLDIKPADVEEVQVTRRLSGQSLIGGRPKATWELKGDELTLSVDCGTLASRCSISYEVLVPRRVTPTIKGENGTISASGFGTGLRIRTGNGAVSVTDASGPLTLESENGELRATGVTSRRVDASSQNGQIHLSLTTVPDKVGVTTENGAVQVEVPKAAYKVVTTTENGSVSADVPRDDASPHTITIRTLNGPIALRTAR